MITAYKVKPWSALELRPAYYTIFKSFLLQGNTDIHSDYRVEDERQSPKWENPSFDRTLQRLAKHQALRERAEQVDNGRKPTRFQSSTSSIPTYTHWAWLDMDMVVGDLPAWLELEELHDFDIVSYDANYQQLYLHGQFTFFNLSSNNACEGWIKLPHLSSALLDNFHRKAHDRSCNRSPKACYEAEEGAFSYIMFQLPDIKIKLAGKAVVFRLSPIHYIQGAIRSCGSFSKNNCDLSTPLLPLSRVKSEVIEVDPTFPCPMLQKIGDMLPLLIGDRCPMSWVRLKYWICSRQREENSHVLYINGHWYMQKFKRNVVENGLRRGKEYAVGHFRTIKSKLQNLDKLKELNIITEGVTIQSHDRIKIWS